MPQFSCFRKERDNKTWTVAKLNNFEEFNLSIGELLYIIIYCFLNKTRYDNIKERIGICRATIVKIKGKIRHIIHDYYDKLPKLGENGEIIEIDESKFVKVKPKIGPIPRKV